MAPDVIIIHSMPPIRQGATLIEPTPSIIDAVGNAPAHMIYLSSTGVYGATVRVDEETPVAPCTETQHCRVAAERLVLAGPWPALALRLAAIYGPQRGMHASMRTGRYRIVDDGLNYVSHIHVDDLVTHIIAGIEMRLTGVFPVADEQPAQTVAVAALCANLLNLPLPPRITRSQAHETQQFSRRVDGAAIRRLLGLSLRFPTYHSGIPAAIAASHSDALQTAIGS
jgi:nucleoside-diphosphate-sugar epimerase